jgi:hypothetical protein
MIQWVMQALAASKYIARSIVIGLPPNIQLSGVTQTEFLPDTGSMLDNLRAAMRAVRTLDPTAQCILVASADIPSITGEIVDQRIEKALPMTADIDYAVVERRIMEARFPSANRSYVRLRDAEVCGGDLSFCRLDLEENEALWEDIVAARKNVFKQASLLGLDLLVLMLLRRLSLSAAESKVSARLGLRGKLTLSPHAEVAMDIDTLDQLELLRADLASGGHQT